MMLPVAVGVKSSSSCTLASPPLVLEVEENDRIIRYQRMDTELDRVTMAVSDDQQFLAIVSVAYYQQQQQQQHQQQHQQQQQDTLAHVTVQVSNLTKPFSSMTRATVHKIHLPRPPPSPAPSSSSLSLSSPAKATVVFGPQNRHLLLLIPTTTTTTATAAATTGVVFQLRRPRKQPPLRAPPPLPSYISTNSSLEQQQQQQQQYHLLQQQCSSHGMIATNAKVIQHANGMPFFATSLCPIVNSFLDILWLISDTDGSLWVLSKGWRLAGPIYLSGHDDDDDGDEVYITHMQHQTLNENSNNNNNNNNDNTSGKLVLLNTNGHATILKTQWTTQHQEYLELQRRAAERAVQQQSSSVGVRGEEQRGGGGGDGDEEEVPDDKVEELDKAGVKDAADDNDDGADDTEAELVEYNPEEEDVDEAEDQETSAPPTSPSRTLQHATSSFASIERPETKTEEPLMLYLMVHFESSRADDAVFVGCTWVANDLIAFLHAPTKSEPVVADVWSCTQQQSITKLTMTTERLDEVAHGSVAIDDDGQAPKGTSFGIQLDPVSNSLAISSTLASKEDVDKKEEKTNSRGFSCVWNWRSNVLGLTLQHTGSSSRVPLAMYFANDEKNERHLTHVRCCSERTFRKHCIPAGLLSPPETRGGFGCCAETLPLLAAAQSVSFPVYYKISERADGEIEWRQAQLPQSYVAANGSPVVATIGRRRCKSIAVAAERGFCVLDSSRLDDSKRTATPKWRLFGDESEERSFSVLAMTWWEGAPNEGGGVDNNERGDDILVAVIETNEVVARRRRPTRYLACWSIRRLGMKYQLVKHKSMSNDKGYRLPREFSPESLSVLADPNVDAGIPRRCVALISSTTNKSFMTFRLQVVNQPPLQETIDKTYSVICSEFVTGSLSRVPGMDDSRCSLFLAGASFGFDLTKESDYNDGDDSIVLCMVKPFGGACTVVVSQSRVCSVADLVEGKTKTVSAFALTDITSRFFVWSFLTSNGLQICWMVPHNMTSERTSLFSQTTGKGFVPVIEGDSKHAITGGAVTCIGEASTWMIGSPQQTRTDIAIGTIPGSNFGCVLLSGQHGKKNHRTVTGDFDHSIFTSCFLEDEFYSLQDGSITPPAFLTSLVACLQTGVFRNSSGDCESLRQHFFDRLGSVSQRDTVMMALRLLALRAVESVCADPNSAAASTLFEDVVQLIRQCFPGVNFARLLLGIGRQVEPKTVAALFPLPLTDVETKGSDFLNQNKDMSEVKDLYKWSAHQGSLSVPTIALPLLQSRIMSLEESHDVLYHCLYTILKNADSADFDFSNFERLFVQDLFRFGVQMEDLDETEFWGDEDVEIVLPPVESPSRPERRGGQQMAQIQEVESNTKMKDDDKEVLVAPPPIQKKQSRTFASMFLPRSMICRGRKNREERAVYEAASSFIVSGFEEGDYEVVVKAEQTQHATVDDRREGITWMLSAFLVRVSLEQCRWKLAASMAQLVVDSIEAEDDAFIDWIDRVPAANVDEFCQRQSRRVEPASDAYEDYQSPTLTFLQQRLPAVDITATGASSLMKFAMLLLSRLRAGPPKNEAVGIGLMLIALLSGAALDNGSLECLKKGSLESALREWSPPTTNA